MCREQITRYCIFRNNCFCCWCVTCAPIVRQLEAIRGQRVSTFEHCFSPTNWHLLYEMKTFDKWNLLDDDEKRGERHLLYRQRNFNILRNAEIGLLNRTVINELCEYLHFAHIYHK